MMPEFSYEYNCILFGYDILYSICPNYFKNFVSFDRCRSESRNPYYVKPLPHPPKTKYGNRIFANSFSRFWNDLPDHIKMESMKPLFKTRLKNHILEKQSNV